MNKLLIVPISCLCISAFSNAVQIKDSYLMKATALKKARLFHHDNQFYVEKSGIARPVQRCFTSPEIRNVKSQQLKGYLRSGGYLRLKEMMDDRGHTDYKLEANGRLDGGGPITAGVLYWGTKALCYGTAVAGAGTLLVGTGGAGGALLGGGLAMATSGATVGTTVVAGTIAGAGLATEAATLATAVATGAGGIAGAMGAVETASLGAAAIGLWLPLP